MKKKKQKLNKKPKKNSLFFPFGSRAPPPPFFFPLCPRVSYKRYRGVFPHLDGGAPPHRFSPPHPPRPGVLGAGFRPIPLPQFLRGGNFPPDFFLPIPGLSRWFPLFTGRDLPLFLPPSVIYSIPASSASPAAGFSVFSFPPPGATFSPGPPGAPSTGAFLARPPPPFPGVSHQYSPFPPKKAASPPAAVCRFWFPGEPGPPFFFRRAPPGDPFGFLVTRGLGGAPGAVPGGWPAFWLSNWGRVWFFWVRGRGGGVFPPHQGGSGTGLGDGGPPWDSGFPRSFLGEF